MTDRLIDQLAPASFRGVSFRVRAESQGNSGRRVILHEYPNSSQRSVEDLGQIPPTFQITAFVHGVNYIADARALEAALSEAGAGELTLPTFGTFQAYALPYTKDADQQAVGEITFTLSFALGRPTPGPSASESRIEDLYERGDTARLNIQTVLSNLWTPPATRLNIATAQYDLMQVAGTARDQYQTLISTDELGEFNSSADAIDDARTVLVKSGDALAAAVVQNTPADPGLIQQISLGVPNGGGTIPGLRGVNFGAGLSVQSSDIFDATPETIATQDLRQGGFSSFINLWPTDTAQRRARNDNRRCLVEAYRVSSLVFAYEQAAAADYATEDEIIETRELLYQAYDAVMRDGVEEAEGASAIQSDPNVRAAVEDVRAVAGDILERKAQSSPSLTDVGLNQTSSSFALAYSLYAEMLTTSDAATDAAIVVRGLNPTLPNTSITGDVTIFDEL